MQAGKRYDASSEVELRVAAHDASSITDAFILTQPRATGDPKGGMGTGYPKDGADMSKHEDGDAKLRITLGTPVAELRAAVARSINDRRLRDGKALAAAQSAQAHVPVAPSDVELLLAGWIAMQDGSCLGDYGLIRKTYESKPVEVLVAVARPMPPGVAATGGAKKKKVMTEKKAPASDTSFAAASLGRTAPAGSYEGPLQVTLSPFIPDIHVKLGALDRTMAGRPLYAVMVGGGPQCNYACC